jgi:hypothetical protein
LAAVSKGFTISPGREIGSENSGLAVSLLFAAGGRPEVAAIRPVIEKQREFSVSFDPSAEPAFSRAASDGLIWLELLANGLTFDLVGLSPGAPSAPAPCAHGYALAANAEAAGFEAVTIRPGPHLGGGHAMMPVIRSLAWLGATLAEIEGVQGVAWHPARSWCGTGYFRDSVLRWIEGGVFPALGLTALAVTADGGMQSEGLALFAGQELRIEPELLTDPAEAAKIGVRLIDRLVESGRIDRTERVTGPAGEPLRIEPSANGRFVRVWRG